MLQRRLATNRLLDQVHCDTQNIFKPLLNAAKSSHTNNTVRNQLNRQINVADRITATARHRTKHTQTGYALNAQLTLMHFEPVNNLFQFHTGKYAEFQT